MMICLMTLGCTLGPRTKTEYIVVGVGKPIVILENVTVKGQRLDAPEGSQPVSQNISGWVAMPHEHFEALKRAVEGR